MDHCNYYWLVAFLEAIYKGMNPFKTIQVFHDHLNACFIPLSFYLTVYESICNMPAVRGYCQGSNIIRWHYNTVSGRCDTFRYSGCGGNENNFDTPNQCAAKCEIGESSEVVVCQEILLTSNKLRIKQAFPLCFKREHVAWMFLHSKEA